MADDELILWFTSEFSGFTISALDMICMFLGELVGTTFLLFFGCMGNINWSGTEQPQFVGGFVFGLTVLTIIQCFGHISAAHLNPAVTLCALLYRAISIPVCLQRTIPIIMFLNKTT